MIKYKTYSATNGSVENINFKYIFGTNIITVKIRAFGELKSYKINYLKQCLILKTWVGSPVTWDALVQYVILPYILKQVLQ